MSVKSMLLYCVVCVQKQKQNIIYKTEESNLIQSMARFFMAFSLLNEKTLESMIFSLFKVPLLIKCIPKGSERFLLFFKTPVKDHYVIF